MIKHKLAGLALAAGIALAGVVTAAPAATAAPTADEVCKTTKYGCLWHNNDFKSQAIEIYGNDDDLGGDSDEAHSAWNNSPYYLVMFDHTGFNGSCIYLAPKWWVWKLGAEWGDRISSIQFHQFRPSGCDPVGQPV